MHVVYVLSGACRNSSFERGSNTGWDFTPPHTKNFGVGVCRSFEKSAPKQRLGVTYTGKIRQKMLQH